MRVFVNYKTLWMLAWLVCWPPLPVRAECCAAQVKMAQLVREGQNYLLSADIDYQFSEKALAALQNGVPLFWELQIKIQQPRELLWSKTLAETSIRYRLQYHALLNMYRVKNESNGDVQNVSSLAAALDLMSTLRNFHILDNAGFAPAPATVLALKVDFDRNALPLPLRPLAYLSKQWYLSSDWTLWPLKN